MPWEDHVMFFLKIMYTTKYAKKKTGTFQNSNLPMPTSPSPSPAAAAWSGSVVPASSRVSRSLFMK